MALPSRTTQASSIESISDSVPSIDSTQWQGYFGVRESSLHQLAPYIGKMKSGMARVLVRAFSAPGDIVLDPFCGSGAIPLEAALLGRRAWANDLNPYAYVLTRGKLFAPASERAALSKAEELLSLVEQRAAEVNVADVPDWVSSFFDPQTLREIIAAFAILSTRDEPFLVACLLGILHHQRPGFLSYPASHLVPYLRTNKFPQRDYPELYEYRDLRSRLLAKVRRAYKNHILTDPDGLRKRLHKVWQVHSTAMPCRSATVDVIISSPPYFGALDYARDNRLRLWFLGQSDSATLDSQLTARRSTYAQQMALCIREMCRVLKRGAYCILVLGDVNENGKVAHTADLIADLAPKATTGAMQVKAVYDDDVPDERRARRYKSATMQERVLVLRRVV